MLVNKDPLHAIDARVEFSNGGRAYRFSGPVTQAVFGQAQYVWHGSGRTAFAQPDGPALVQTVAASSSYTLAPGSITVLRGKNR
jgi:hypothetical protein